LWHVDSSFNPCRASYSLLLAHVLRANGGGDTHFADTRTAYKNIPQTNPDGTKTIYVVTHASHVVGWPKEEGFKLIWELIYYVPQPEYVLRVNWENSGDSVNWDDRATEFEGQTVYPRDLRRTTVCDGSPSAFGCSEVYINNDVHEPTQLQSGMGNHVYARTHIEKCLTDFGEIEGDWHLERQGLGLPRTDQKKKSTTITGEVVNGVILRLNLSRMELPLNRGM
jgi:Taurine catabolism dioxygenase TauD, TfdA family